MSAIDKELGAVKREVGQRSVTAINQVFSTESPGELTQVNVVVDLPDQQPNTGQFSELTGKLELVQKEIRSLRNDGGICANVISELKEQNGFLRNDIRLLKHDRGIQAGAIAELRAKVDKLKPPTLEHDGIEYISGLSKKRGTRLLTPLKSGNYK